METAPSVPAGFQLIAVSEGDLQQAPGLGMTARELAAFGDKSTIISVLPTADAPAGTTISWSGYARAGVVHKTSNTETTNSTRAAGVSADLALTVTTTEAKENDTNVTARGQIRVKAATDTAVGEVGVDVRVRGNWSNGGGDNANAIVDVAWGYWSMTPELTLGGGFAGSVGNIGYGMDGACSCYFASTVDFNPGDATQMRLTYASGPLSFAVAVEDRTSSETADKLGASGEIKFSGDIFSAEVSGTWRDLRSDDSNDADATWQVGTGVGIGLGDMASLSLAAAMGVEQRDAAGSIAGIADDNTEAKWWGVSGLAKINLSDEIHAELGGGYKKWDGKSVSTSNEGYDIKTWTALAGMYYNPVDQLTIGVEGSYSLTKTEKLNDPTGSEYTQQEIEAKSGTVALVSVWRF
jgi:hypothetical protein